MKNEYYNIKTRKMEPVFENYAPSGQPAVPSDQGREYTCVSHSVGKVIVEIADMFGLNTDQNQIIQHLIRAFQPTKGPMYVQNLNNKSIAIAVWEKAKPDYK